MTGVKGIAAASPAVLFLVWLNVTVAWSAEVPPGNLPDAALSAPISSLRLEKTAPGQPSGVGIGVFYSRGLAIHSLQDPVKGRNAAVKDFLAQAVVQAAATILKPAELGKHYQAIQEKLLQEPNRYVQGFEVLGEEPDQGGLYRISGLVTVKLDLLKRDLSLLGLEDETAEPGKDDRRVVPDNGDEDLQKGEDTRDEGELPGPEEKVVPEEAGELVLHVRSKDAYADWLALEKTLREHFKDMQVKGFEIRPEGVVVRVAGTSGAGVMNLDGTLFPNGLKLKITSQGEGGGSLSVTFVKGESSPEGPKQ